MVARNASRAAALGVGLMLAACGGDSGSPTTPSTPPPDVAGSYWASWTLQVLRKSDGFQTSFNCSGQLTLVQGASAAGTAPLTGFAVVGYPCAAESYDLKGSVVAGGGVEFTTNGPRPLEGPCPGGTNVAFSGQITSQDSWRSLSARGVATVQCPEFGEHEFTYIIQGSR
jgi:hypothetical protein